MATRICPQCGTETQAPFCRADGFATVDSARYLGRDLHNREGDTLAGRYRLDQVLGRTALGSHYRATDLRLGNPVALRLLASGLATDLGLIARFQREGRLVASLAHPNIVHVMEHGVAEDGTLFIAQELVAGPTLAEALARGGAFDPTRVVALGRELFDALSEAHTHGVLHRSLGLDNITIVTRPGGGESLKIGDFGLVHVLADDNATPFVFPQVLSGAWRAMAPEQARGRGVSGHADIYSVGAILYELLTGKPLFGDASPSDLLVAHSVKMPPAPERDGRILAGPLVELITRCLEKKPWNRPDGAQKALDLLELCRAQPILPLPSPTAEFAAPPAGATAGGVQAQRVKPRTNPYGYLSPAASQTRPSLPPAPPPEPASLPTNGTGVARPGKPTRLRGPTAPEISPAPRAAGSAGDQTTTTTARSSLPGASAARAESTDRGFASRADLHRSGRDGDDLAPRSRSPIVWFLAGVIATGLVAFALTSLSGDGNKPEPIEAGTRHATAGGPNVAPPGTAGTNGSPGPNLPARRVEEREPATTGVAANDVFAPDSAPSGPDTIAPETTVAVAADTVAAPSAPDTLSVANAAEVAAVGVIGDAGPSRVDAAQKDPKRETKPKVVDPLADLEDPEFSGNKSAPPAAAQKVLIDSDPVGANVSLGGQIVGETPMTVEWHGDGADVVVSKVGYRPVHQRLGTGTGRAIRIVLPPAN